MAKARPGRLHVTHSGDAKFSRRGLRSHFEYRDLGIADATGGKAVAHVIRAIPGKTGGGEWHRHDCEVQFTYVLKGWVEFEYAGVGKVTMRAGTCFYQPPNLPHRELRHSKNLELLEVVAPARFETLDAPPPAAAAARKATRRTPTRAARRR